MWSPSSLKTINKFSQPITFVFSLSFGFPSGAAGGGDSHHRAGNGQHGHVSGKTATERQNDQNRVPYHFIQQVNKIVLVNSVTDVSPVRRPN